MRWFGKSKEQTIADRLLRETKTREMVLELGNDRYSESSIRRRLGDGRMIHLLGAGVLEMDEEDNKLVYWVEPDYLERIREGEYD